MKIEVEFSDIIRLLSEKLKKDPDYYYSWQANIAMAFIDEYYRSKEKNIHEISNNAAKYFLDLLGSKNENNRVFLKKPTIVLKDE